MDKRLRLDEVDIEMLTTYVDSRDYGAAHFDPLTGEVYPAFDGEVLGADGERVDLEDVDWRPIGGSSRAAYEDMERFAEAVTDPVVAGQLRAALGGKASFRRFGDQVHRQPEEFSRAWHHYRHLRASLRAVEWLRDEQLVPDSEAADRARVLAQEAEETLALVGIAGARTENEPTVDEVFARYGSEPSVALEVRLVNDDSTDPFVLVSGQRRALRFLAEALLALADSPDLPASKQLGPRGAGTHHLSSRTNVDVYLQCIEITEEE